MIAILFAERQINFRQRTLALIAPRREVKQQGFRSRDPGENRVYASLKSKCSRKESAHVLICLHIPLDKIIFFPFFSSPFSLLLFVLPHPPLFPLPIPGLTEGYQAFPHLLCTLYLRCRRAPCSYVRFMHSFEMQAGYDEGKRGRARVQEEKGMRKER